MSSGHAKVQSAHKTVANGPKQAILCVHDHQWRCEHSAFLLVGGMTCDVSGSSHYVNSFRALVSRDFEDHVQKTSHEQRFA